MDASHDFGYLIVRVTAADGALPIEGALVEVSDSQGGGVISVMKTDRSGLTPKLQLPTPPKSASQQPNGGVPYRQYNIRTTKEGYYAIQDVFVPIYPTVTSVQGVAMIPLEYGNNGSIGVQPRPDDLFFDESRSPNL